MTLYTDPAKFSLATDLYELTMMQGYFFQQETTRAVFDVFFRRQPFGGGYSVFAGLEPALDMITAYSFSGDDIAYLRSMGIFKDEFLEYLRGFKFTGDVYAMPEGSVAFPNVPLVRVHGSAMEAQIVESALLNIINFQTLIATKTGRVVNAAAGKPVLEFGLRRAQGLDGALSASRAAYIGGAAATSNALAGKLFGIPAKGTMAHSWVMSFESEQQAFDAYADLYPDATVLLVDTYDTLGAGVPNAIKTLSRLKERGHTNTGIRLDSGDLEYIATEARRMLDAAGLTDTTITASNELDEHIIESLVAKGAPIDSFGVGTNLVTAKDDPSLTGVYKLAAQQKNGEYVPALKISNDPQKTTNPGIKNVLRLSKEGEILGDLLFLESERAAIETKVASREPITFIHPDYSYKSMVIDHYDAHTIMLSEVVRNGERVHDPEPLSAIRARAANERAVLHPSYKRLLNPHVYKVSVTPALMDLKMKLVQSHAIKKR